MIPTTRLLPCTYCLIIVKVAINNLVPHRLRMCIIYLWLRFQNPNEYSLHPQPSIKYQCNFGGLRKLVSTSIIDRLWTADDVLIKISTCMPLELGDTSQKQLPDFTVIVLRSYTCIFNAFDSQWRCFDDSVCENSSFCQVT